jgi:hypothetical protein
MADSIEQLGFRLTSDELAAQERAVAALRTCAGTVLAAASVAGSFLGAGLRHGSLDVLGLLAMASFALCCACAVWVLLPHGLVFVLSGDALLRLSDESAVSEVGAAYRAATTWVEQLVRLNRAKIALLDECFTVSCLLLAAEVALWTIALTV